MKKVYLFLVAFVFLGFCLSAQNNGGAIQVTLTDKKTKEGIPFANVVVFNGKTQVAVGTTDMDGMVTLKPLNAGKYNVSAVYLGYQKQEINDVLVKNNATSYLKVPMSNEGVDLDPVVVTTYKVPLVDPNVVSGGTVDRESFQNMSDKSVNSVISTQAGVILTDNGSSTSIQVRGSRKGNTNIFVDGERAIGTTNMPQGAVEEMSVMLGGLPAQYGDVTGGAVSITTRGTQPKWFGGVELISSELTDPYGYNFGGFSLGGPLVSKKDSAKNKIPIVGFFMAGQGVYQKDPRPWATGIAQVNPTKLAQLEQTPLQYNQANNTFYAASSFLTPNDITYSKTRPNVGNKQISLAPKIDFQINPNLRITLGGNWDYNNYRTFSQEYSLLNSQHNPQVIENTMRGYVRLTQRFGAQGVKASEQTQSIISNANFSFQAGYQKYKYTQEDAQFKNDYFSYGYVGKFNELQSNIFTLKDSVKVGNTYKKNVYVNTGVAQDTAITFQPGTQNPLAANYTSQVYNTLPAGSINNFTQIYNAQGLVNGNGSVPPNVQGLYYNTGRTTGAFSIRDNSVFRVTSNFSADIKHHSVMVGVEYDQRNERGVDINARGLYSLAYQLANNHNQNLDTTGTNGTYYATLAAYQAANGGHALNTTQTQGAPITASGTGVYVVGTAYNAAAQSVFSKNFYDQVMGIHNGQSTQYIDVNNYDPSNFNLKMFSADELLNSGNQLVSGWGYDYAGNRLAGSGKVNFSDFLTKFTTDKFGDQNYNRLVGAFMPVYMAGYIQDKFDYKDLKFNVGLRIDRYDANQMVLKDPFLLKDAFTTSDLGSLSGQFTGNIPSSIPKDAVIYVADNSQAVKQITGFRSGSNWYDATGALVSDPKVIAETSGGQAQPWLKNPSDKTPYSNSAFTAYKPQINVMPRVAFSFPITDVASFFAHYDILTQRPPASQSDGVNGSPYYSFNRTDPTQYYFLSSHQGAVVNNGNLKPERTVDYELGFQQILSQSSVLKLSGFYREMRNQVQITRVNQAYPLSYLTYGNIDFGTVKGFSAEFQLRRTGGFSLNANYTLQFADGSGSNANGGYNLVNSSQPNLRVITPLDYDQRHTFTATFDYRFGQGTNYHGPQSSLKKKNGTEKNVQWLKDLGVNFVARLGSGTPYSQRTPAASDEEIGNNITQYLAGSLNGSRYPWQFRVDMRIDKNISMQWGSPEKGDKRKRTNMNIYLQVLNLFNTKNVINVHSYTGSPSDDGYLSSAFGINEINQKYAQSVAFGQGFTTLYNSKLVSGAYYSMPRMIRIGLQFDF